MSESSISPRRQLRGSWLDWNERLPSDFKPHCLDRDKILPAARDLRAFVAHFGPDSVVTHRAQAIFLAACRPEDLFGLLYLAADVAADEVVPDDDWRDYLEKTDSA